MRTSWMISGGTALALAAGTAQVQDEAGQSGKGEPPAGLTEIVVTAQRKVESAQRAGLAIDVVGRDELSRAGVTSSLDIGKLVPALTVQQNGGPNAVFFLRGVGNFTVNGYSDPAIASNYDGVYLGRPTSTSGMFYDLDLIGVLKGPQGTLYGRNATGGAIDVLPAKPRIGEFSGSVVIAADLETF